MAVPWPDRARRPPVRRARRARAAGAAFVDNLLFLRFVESRGQVRRLLSLTKMRDSHCSPGLHSVEITATGMRIAGLYTSEGDVIPSARPVEGRATPSSSDGKAES